MLRVVCCGFGLLLVWFGAWFGLVGFDCMVGFAIVALVACWFMLGC